MLRSVDESSAGHTNSFRRSYFKTIVDSGPIEDSESGGRLAYCLDCESQRLVLKNSCVWKLHLGHRRGGVAAVEPKLDCLAFVALPIGGNDWVAHQFVGDLAREEVQSKMRRLRRRWQRTHSTFVLIDDFLLALYSPFESLNGAT